MSFIGFTKSYRAKWDNPVFRNLLEAAIWAWMCDSAAWEDCRVRFNGHLVSLKRGQLITARRFIAKGFCVGERVIRTFLDHLEIDQMITQQVTHPGTIITICNYEKYQSQEKEADPAPTRNTTQHRPSTDPNKKETKKLKKEYTSDFEIFWKAYPRKDGSKEKAFESYLKALEEITHEALIRSVSEYASHITRTRTQTQHVAHAATWIHQKRWEAEYCQSETTDRDRQARAGARTLL